MANLHDLTGEYLALQDALESDDPATVESALQRIGTVEDALEAKHLAVACVIRNAEDDLCGLEAERDRIVAKIERAQKRVDGLKRFVRDAMACAGIDKIKGPSFTITRRMNPYSVIVEDEDQVPAQFMVMPPPQPPKARPDKAAIKEAVLKLGEVIPGVRVERGERLEIK